MCPICDALLTGPLFEHVLSNHRFRQQESPMIKNHLEREEKKQTLPLQEDDQKQRVQGSDAITISKSKMEEMYQCTVCCTVPHLKVLQCPSGHITCERCSRRAETCPTCRVPLDRDITKRIRNLVAEQTIEEAKLSFPCGNYGGDFSGPKKDLLSHEDMCNYIPCGNDGCRFSGFKTLLEWHRERCRSSQDVEGASTSSDTDGGGRPTPQQEVADLMRRLQILTQRQQDEANLVLQLDLLSRNIDRRM